MKLAHPRFVYGGMDPVYLNRAEIADLGNPSNNPEVAVAYEVGIKGQFNRDFGYTFTAFYKDYFDFIVNKSVVVRGVTGGLETKSFAFNQDYARVRGAEIMISYRLSSMIRAMANASFQVATGKSNTAAESRLQIINQGNVDLTKEQYLAWDRPLDLKGTLIFTPDTSVRFFGIPMKYTRVFVSSTWKSGLRYTPAIQVGTDDLGRPRYESDSKNPYSKLATPWFWTDIKITRDFPVGKKRFISASIEISNAFNNKNAQIINPVTGTAYQDGDQLLYSARDPNYPSPLDFGTPPNNPARYMQPRQIVYGVAFNF
jgi:outer membrane receptor protein involved in Fe transport